MNKPQTFYHALAIDESRCIGCSHCMKICPTDAVRIRNGKASILEGRCIDCGKCYTACPAKAIYIKQDDFDSIQRYAHSVALLPAVFLGQFPDEIRVSRIYAALKDLGFKHVFEVESAAAIYALAKHRYAAEHVCDEPLISSFCPAIVRLVQVKYPSLVGSIMPIKAPLDISAEYALKILEKSGVPRQEVGLFYITPCAAKIAAVKAPVGEAKSIIDGVINMDSLYNRVFKKIKEQGKTYVFPPLQTPRLSSDAILSTLTNGERRLCYAKRSYAIDGIENVMDFLDKLENEEIEGVEFLEMRACDQSCAGANLACDNRFLISERMFNRARKAAERIRNGEMSRDTEMNQYQAELLAESEVQRPQSRSMESLDPDISKALEKMEQINKLKSFFPQIDCGLCGAPTCDALATDIVCGSGCKDDCVFVQRHQEACGEMSAEESVDRMKDIWGQDRILGKK